MCSGSGATSGNCCTLYLPHSGSGTPHMDKYPCFPLLQVNLPCCWQGSWSGYCHLVLVSQPALDDGTHVGSLWATLWGPMWAAHMGPR